MFLLLTDVLTMFISLAFVVFAFALLIIVFLNE